MSRLDSTAEDLSVVHAQIEHPDVSSSPGDTARSARQVGIVQQEETPPGTTQLSGWHRFHDRRLARKYTEEVLTSPECEVEVHRLADEHRSILRKKMLEGLSPTETRRLAMVRWQLDRLRDAKGGEALDVIEALVIAQEMLAHRLGVLSSQVERAKMR